MDKTRFCPQAAPALIGEVDTGLVKNTRHHIVRSIKGNRQTDRRTQGRRGPRRPAYLGIIVHVHDIDWPVSVTHEKYSVFIGLKDIQQVHVSTTVYEDKIVELRKGRGPCE